ncbi:hypothetical protein Adt_42155 [Abeliophyllum distichum]|uniref:Uncharacterized protein n=1 Tax=Abeliophyllum distichum TaxID=126358 RepID=A0ABD1PRP7_9LAMI
MGRFQLVLLLLVATIFIIHGMDGGSANAESGPQKMVADPPKNNERESIEAAEAPQKHHSSFDKSVAGGGVIIGGLVTAIFAAVYCYIRLTRTRTRTAATDDHILV